MQNHYTEKEESEREKKGEEGEGERKEDGRRNNVKFLILFSDEMIS